MLSHSIMTTIAYINKVLYSDSLKRVHNGTSDYFDFSPKIYRSTCGRYAYGVTGNFSETVEKIVLEKTFDRALLDCYSPQNFDRLFPEDVQQIIGKMISGFILMTREHLWVGLTNEPDVEPVLWDQSTFAVVGSGVDVLTAAMLLGKSGKDAMMAAIKYDTMTGGPLVQISQDSLKPYVFLSEAPPAKPKRKRVAK